MSVEVDKIDYHTRYIKTNCIQYALITTLSGEYPCYNTKGYIYLEKGSVWKYGKTCNGEKGRYGNRLKKNHLEFVIEFEGTEKECLMMEKYKIYTYPLFHRNGLLRPPGNKIDR